MSDADGPSRLNHTDYEITSADRTLHETVRNGDDEPARVFLSQGRYLVEAQSDTAGTVTVPVAIEAGRTTVVHLERKKDWKDPSTEKRDLVSLPNGQPIGVRARKAMPAKS